MFSNDKYISVSHAHDIYETLSGKLSEKKFEVFRPSFVQNQQKSTEIEYIQVCKF